MFKFFENLIDPYRETGDDHSPPTRLAPFLWSWSRPFLPLFGVLMCFSALVAGLEIRIIAYLGGLVEVISSLEPGQFWR